MIGPQPLVCQKAPPCRLDGAAERCHRAEPGHPLAQGFLSGRYSADQRPRSPVRRHSTLFRPGSLARARPLLAALDEIARVHDATPSQVALAWTIRHPNVVAIPGASSLEQLEANAAAANLELSSAEVESLDDAPSSFTART